MAMRRFAWCWFDRPLRLLNLHFHHHYINHSYTLTINYKPSFYMFISLYLSSYYTMIFFILNSTDDFCFYLFLPLLFVMREYFTFFFEFYLKIYFYLNIVIFLSYFNFNSIIGRKITILDLISFYIKLTLIR